MLRKGAMVKAGENVLYIRDPRDKHDYNTGSPVRVHPQYKRGLV